MLSGLRSRLVTEILVVDDGSSDASPRLLQALSGGGFPQLRNLTPPEGGNRGAAPRLNQLIEAARSDWIAVLNSDDAFLPGRFETINLKVRRSDTDFVSGNLVIKDAMNRGIGQKRGPADPEYPFPQGFDVAAMLGNGGLIDLLANQNFIATTSNMAFRKSVWQRVGGFRDHRYVHDWDFALRAAATSKAVHLPVFLTAYRVHASNTIKENLGAIAVEVKQVFKTLAEDFPALAERPGFRAGLAGNRYLA
jgi:glycosyltransferase involved in cell wall biosynthesis